MERLSAASFFKDMNYNPGKAFYILMPKLVEAQKGKFTFASVYAKVPKKLKEQYGEKRAYRYAYNAFRLCVKHVGLGYGAKRHPAYTYV